MFTIKVGDADVDVHIDVCGNIYLKKTTEQDADMMYQLCINGNDDPYLDYGDYSVIKKSQCFAPEELSDDVEILKEPVRGIIRNTDDFYDDKYYIEENGYSFDRKDKKTKYDLELEDIYLNDDVDIYFIFYEKNETNIIENRKNGDVPALYDTFMYDDTVTPAELQLTAKINTLNNIYRVNIYKSGKFYFRVMGNSFEKKYALCLTTPDKTGKNELYIHKI